MTRWLLIQLLFLFASAEASATNQIVSYRVVEAKNIQWKNLESTQWTVEVTGKIDAIRASGVRFDSKWCAFNRKTGDFKFIFFVNADDLNEDKRIIKTVDFYDLDGKKTTQKIDLTSFIQAQQNRLTSEKQVWFDFDHSYRLSLSALYGSSSFVQSGLVDGKGTLASVQVATDYVNLFNRLLLSARVRLGTGQVGGISFTTEVIEPRIAFSLWNSANRFRVQASLALAYHNLSANQNFGYSGLAVVNPGIEFIANRAVGNLGGKISLNYGRTVNPSSSGSIIPLGLEIWHCARTIFPVSLLFEYEALHFASSDFTFDTRAVSAGLNYHF